MNTSEWLKSLKPGDSVIVSFNNSTTLGIVNQVTEAMIILKSRQRFSKKNGHHIAPRGGYDLCFISPWIGKEEIK